MKIVNRTTFLALPGTEGADIQMSSPSGLSAGSVGDGGVCGSHAGSVSTDEE